MKRSSRIIEGGGWVRWETAGRPRARFFGFLSAVWLPVSVCASHPVRDGLPEAFGALDWLCGALLLPQPVFVVLAIAFLLIERPRTFAEQHYHPTRGPTAVSTRVA